MSAKRDHTEPLVLDALTVAEPSFKKSPVISMVKRPYVQFAQEWNEKNKQDIFKMQAERNILVNQLNALEKKDDVTAEEIAELQTELSNIPQSNFRRIVVDDITPESLVHQLEETSSELAAYKKKEAERGLLHRADLKSSAKRISTEDELKRKLSRAMTVIDRYGLRSEYEHTTFSQSKNTELE